MCKSCVGKLIVGIAAVAASVTGALAETCKYVDPEGRVTYSNVELKSAKKITCFGEPPPPISSPRPQGRPTSAPAQPANFPSVDNQTQKKRDLSRRKILEDELATEQKLLGEAKQALADGEAVRLGSERNYERYLERIQQLKDTVTLHEKNLTALRQEISALK